MDGIVVVDKPAGRTSHDVVAKVRRIAGTRRVGHAGTLDPMATGVLIIGVNRATRLLGHLAAHDKTYEATIRLGVTTVSDDADGEVVSTVAAAHVTDEDIAAGIAALTGDIEQVPSTVSAIKVGGVRSYARVRAGEDVALAARPVTVSAFDVLARRGDELDVRVSCTTGTYIRALARDLGASLGVGAHLTSLRRTRSGSFTVDEARTVDALEQAFTVVSLADAVARCFPRVDLDADTTRDLRHGRPIAATGRTGAVGAFDAATGDVLALVQDDGEVAKPLVVFAPA
ncbi:MAG TPA: tRNA pseudouridine(55) synthase TruB [Mycobacteriales bacterium]|nr:tRNA pseudouridine(55) synthase TruB [Mycobacteriales bacterium]